MTYVRHHAADGATFLNCGPAESVRIGLEAAGRKNLEVIRPPSAVSFSTRGLIDEIDLHVVPIPLGEGIRLYDNAGAAPVRLRRVGQGDPVSGRYGRVCQSPHQASSHPTVLLAITTQRT